MADDLFSRAEILSGLPARRASMLLFVLERRTAYLVAHSRQALARFPTAAAVQEPQLAFLEAFALSRDHPVRPTLHDLERYAPQWGVLVPRRPRLQAALAQRLGHKYCVT